MVGARIFVAIVFLLLGASFLASAGVLIHEFQGMDWPALLLAHSHLFFFFPVFGLLALAAFYVPSVVFTHMYWHHVPYGRIRFVIGTIVAAGISGLVSYWLLDAKPRGVWEISPRALATDRGDPAGCGGARAACRRAPIVDALTGLREAAQTRVGLSKFARNCRLDALLETPEEMQKERYCFAAKAKLTGVACCEAQSRLSDAVARLQADPAQRSRSSTLDAVFLPLKVFFVLIVIAIGLMLAFWRDKVDEHYRQFVPAIERGVIIGAFAMLFWPLMDYAYQQTSNVLFGRWQAGPQFRLSLVIAPWALLLLFYFLRRLGKNLEMVGQLSGVAASAIAILRYEEINEWSVRLLGVGTDRWALSALVALALLGLVVLLWPRRAKTRMGETLGTRPL
jgi:hypothetical protein